MNGIASRLQRSKNEIEKAGLRFEDAATRRTRRGRTVWSAGPRLPQARRLLRLRRQSDPNSGWADNVALGDIAPGDPRPVLVVRTLARRGKIHLFQTLSELDAVIDDPELDLSRDSIGFLLPEEIFIHRIEPGADGRAIAIPQGYGENGVWVRGTLDRHILHDGMSAGAGYAYIQECAWFERRITLMDAQRQVDKLHARTMAAREELARWTRLDDVARYRHAQLIAFESYEDVFSAPPLHMRLRCWREVLIEPAGGTPVRLTEEGLRGDDERTATRAIERWRAQAPARADVPITVRSVAIAKRQSRPMPPP